MTKTLFIGSLSYKATEEELTALFKTVGTVVKTNILTHPATGHSRGVAFVEMSTDVEARMAVEKLSGKMLLERKIFVSEAKQKDKKTGKFVGDTDFVERRSGKDRRRSPSGAGKPRTEKPRSEKPRAEKPRSDGAPHKKDKDIRKWTSRPDRPPKKNPWRRQPAGRFAKKDGPAPKKRKRKSSGTGPKKWGRDSSG